MIETVNKIYFKQSDYDSIDAMFNAMFVQELALVKNHYMCLSYKSPGDSNVFVLEFASLEPAFNQTKLLPCWITPDEANIVAEYRINNYRNDLEYVVKDSLKIDDDDDDFNDGGNNYNA